MVEHEKTVVEDGKNVTVKEMVYEYEAEMEESYRSSFGKSFKKTITDGYFPFIIVDNVNDKVKYFGEMWSFAKQNGFQVKFFLRHKLLYESMCCVRVLQITYIFKTDRIFHIFYFIYLMRNNV